MEIDWKKPEFEEMPELGVPLIVKVRRSWEPYVVTEPGVVYYLVDPQTGEKHFFVGADLDTGMIGPDQMQVCAWDYWKPWED